MLTEETTQTTGNSTKLSIVGGKFTLRVDEGTDKSVARQLTKGKNEGKTVWELKYPSLANVTIMGGVITDGEYPGVDITLFDFDEDESSVINFPLDSRYLFELIRRLKVMDMTKSINIEVKEHATKKTRTGNPTFNLQVIQNGRKLSDYYTKWSKDENGKNVCENLYGLPEAVEGRKGWSFEAQEEFLLTEFEEVFKTFITPDKPEVASDSPPASTNEQAPAEPEVPEVDEDEPPF